MCFKVDVQKIERGIVCLFVWEGFFPTLSMKLHVHFLFLFSPFKCCISGTKDYLRSKLAIYQAATGAAAKASSM